MTSAQRRVLEAMAAGDELVRVPGDDLSSWRSVRWLLYDASTVVHAGTVAGLLRRGYIALLEDEDDHAMITDGGRAALAASRPSAAGGVLTPWT